MQVLLNIWQNLTFKRRSQFGLLLCLTLIAAISEMVSLGAVLPFISILTAPDQYISSPIISSLLSGLNITSTQDLIAILTITFGTAALMAGLLRLVLLRSNIWLGNSVGTDLSVIIYRKTLYQPYTVHVTRNSSEVISGITQKIVITTNVIVSLVTLITNIILFLAIMGSLFFINPMISAISMTLFGLAYGIIAWSTRTRLLTNSKIVAKQQNLVMRSLREGFGAIRDIILDNMQSSYIDNYHKAAVKQQVAISENTFMGQAPRYIIETLGMTLIALFVLIENKSSVGLKDVLPTLGLLALGAQRILPIMQQIYGNWSYISGYSGSIIDVFQLLNQDLLNEAHKPAPMALAFNQEIRFNNVSFHYQSRNSLILDQLNLVIPKGARVGILGVTGCGKSTFLDILMGLLDPTQGELLIDGNAINEGNKRAWHRAIAHVPQMIFLSDTTITENIAFGEKLENIDHDRVEKSAKLANAHDFILNSADGYNTIVGERGIRLSGGQRQRIGIARALYKQANILCFDEATSALDNNTENEVMEAIDNLDASLTIIIIAHRLTTLRNCTHFVTISNGKIKVLDTYDQLAVEI